MDELEELGLKIAKLKIVEEDLINEMRILNKSTEDRVHLLCKLEIIRFEIKPLFDEYKSLMYDKFKKESN